MGSTCESVRKRLHFNSISPTAAMAKNQPFSHPSEGTKHDAGVLQYKNQKLAQKLEAQKIELFALEKRFSQIKEKQQPYDSTLKAVNKSWEVMVTDLEEDSNNIRETRTAKHIGCLSINDDEASPSFKDAFLSRLVENGATETSSGNYPFDQVKEVKEKAYEKTKNILGNIVAAVHGIWSLKDGIHAAILEEIPEDGCSSLKESCGLAAELKNLRLALSDLHLKHKTFARELQGCRYIDAKNKAELKRLKDLVSNRSSLCALWFCKGFKRKN